MVKQSLSFHKGPTVVVRTMGEVMAIDETTVQVSLPFEPSK